MPKVYIAARWTNRELAAKYADFFRSEGWEPALEWWTWRPDTPHDLIAYEDIERLREAEVLFLLVSPVMNGAWCELGAALALDKPVLWLDIDGPGANVFLSHPLVRRYDAARPLFDQFSDILGSRRKPSDV